jgi:hypothetical protein
MRKTKKMVASLFATMLLAVGVAAPTASAQPVITGGLVNVTVFDVIDGDVLSNNNVNLGVGLNLAANVCDVNVNVLAVQLRNGGATCETDEQRVVIDQIAG